MYSKILVFVHTLNEEEKIGRLLESLKNQENIEFRIVISDNFSSDNTVKIIKSYALSLDIILIFPPKPMELLEHFFFVSDFCINILGDKEGIIYVGADDYFLETTYLKALNDTRIEHNNSIITPKFKINSLSSGINVMTRGQYKNKYKYIRLGRYLMANHHHCNRFNLGLFSKEMFIYRTSREKEYSKIFKFQNRNGIGEFFTLIDLILKYRVVVNTNATYIKETNNRNISGDRSNDIKVNLSRLNVLRNLIDKNMSTYRLLKFRRVRYRIYRSTFLVLGSLSFIRNFTYDFYFYFRKKIG